MSTDAALSAAAAAPAKAPLSGSGYIIGPIADRSLLIFSPLIALAIGAVISGMRLSQQEVTFLGQEATVAHIFIGSFIMAHLFIVFFRSHGNQAIFKLYPRRFTVVPVVLFLSMTVSDWAAVSVAVIATWWDVYHSAMQTFGIGRIYDMKAGNSATLGRRLDMIVNVLFYAGPIMAGATLMLHIEDFDEFEKVGSLFFTAIPAYTMGHQAFITWAVVALGTPFLVYYVYFYWRAHAQGYTVSYQKVALLASTGLCSIYTWGFNTFGEAFFIMNFFHALQYFALVWWSEKKHMQSFFGLSKISWGRPATFVLFIAVAFAYGIWAETADTSSDLAFNLIMVVSIMHFWYDGFIWSVRKKQ
ncbi:MAG: hypothetical protein ACC661_09400, partial [Verrucomicrobiales bacterium]